jgi:hypothetical protein
MIGDMGSPGTVPWLKRSQLSWTNTTRVSIANLIRKQSHNLGLFWGISKWCAVVPRVWCTEYPYGASQTVELPQAFPRQIRPCVTPANFQRTLLKPIFQVMIAARFQQTYRLYTVLRTEG